jgi:hypothetical protein
MDLLENVNILLRLFIEMMDWLCFRYGSDLWNELLVADSDLFNESIGNTFLGGFSSELGLFVFILVGMVFL